MEIIKRNEFAELQIEVSEGHVWRVRSRASTAHDGHLQDVVLAWTSSTGEEDARAVFAALLRASSRRIEDAPPDETKT